MGATDYELGRRSADVLRTLCSPVQQEEWLAWDSTRIAVEAPGFRIEPRQDIRREAVVIDLQFRMGLTGSD